MVTHSARSRLNREKNVSLFGRPVSASACSFTLRLNLVLTRGVPPDFRDGVYIYCQPSSGQFQIYRVTELPAGGVHCREATGTGPVVLKEVPVTDATAFSDFAMDRFFMRLSFLISTIRM